MNTGFMTLLCACQDYDMNNKILALWELCHQSDFIRWQLTFALSLIEGETASVMLLDEAGENLVFCSSIGENVDKYLGQGKYEDAMRVPMNSEKGINPLVVLFGKPICMEDGDPRHYPNIDQVAGTKTRSLYALPLAAKDRVVGTFSAINAHYKTPDLSRRFHFDNRDLEAMRAASHAVHLWLSHLWEDLER